ncbi:glutathione S-transferase family protein [Dickeya dianthicola]|uniref:Glutathione S-transferase family protein n=1 Tax=Dickeya dianthicola TaxID=204039 RepID=A0AAX1C7V1_9GAMM|nr:glutathione S-transferase family protein [Dickeya dianthicola]MCA7002934.1 glutathione S-transferase family protein [Dickeya dianthicola]MCI4003465.1 glutathione S-transferase family protein [Dickeya dianthicola]MCI4032889.1 glutathione S-transferase family protein [Dickeya dianthicola]MCI4154110.1 glutathione S-transferase family protein [Dickeya dianthicola]MCI4175455.1 glutathione S-transferase family protein [Dickeya dianthicola]
MKQYPVYLNPYNDLRIDADTVLKLNAVTLAENDLSSFVASLSPFASKLQAYFRIFGVKHELVSVPVPDVGPRGKVPFISVGDTQIADSGLIIDYLKRTLGDPDAQLTAEQKALGQVVQGTLEDHLYWVIIYYEFFDQSGWDFLMKTMVGDLSALPAEIQEALRVRREDFRKRCFDQGIARFTEAEIIDKASQDLAAIDVLIGDKRFLLGNDHPSSYDAAVFGFTQAFFQARGMHPEITDFARTLPNLGRFIATITDKWYPELKLAFQPA